ncbi:MAG: DUF262 domain-containing HNH endonuclease family protein [Nanoarchaeota archaeon]|nr:DUF262 domain-containing HNH endonuclease family protein [Nanoarchaeota archaeon]
MKDLESLKSIFKDRIFKIPDYQRGYAWTEDQLKDFWEDLLSLQSGKYHYTGVLSIKEVKSEIWKNWNDERWLLEERGYKSFHVVDGQQRLTTFVIFIQSLYDLLKSLPENKDKPDEEIYIGSFNLKHIKEEYLVIQKPPQFIINSYKFSYEADNPSFDYLRYKIFNESSSGQILETFYTLNLSNAKKFFDKNLKNSYDDLGIKEIENIFKKITQNLMFNLYDISDDFDVYVAFETMNNRGKKLSNLELLKNRLIYLTTLYDDDELKKDDKKALRDKINDAWKEVYYQLGRNKKLILPDDDFLQAHWIMYFPYKRVKGNEYIRFLLNKKFIPRNVLKKIEVDVNSLEHFEEVKEQSEDDSEGENNNNNETILRSELSPKEIEGYVLSLKSTAVHWYNTWNPLNNQDLTKDESFYMDRLNRLGMVYFRPLITSSFLSKKTTSEERISLFTEIERFTFITFRLTRAFSSYRNSEFYGYARQLRNDKISVKKIIDEIHDNMDDWIFDNPENNKQLNEKPFKTYLERLFKNGKGFYAWNGLKYFLYEYEMEKVKERGNQKIDWKLFVKNEKDKVSIEHIFPQTPDLANWDSFQNYSEEELKTLQGSLGNLLPLSQSINSSLQNDSFENKKQPKLDDDGNKIREGYNNGSHSEIEVSQYTNWTPQIIQDRGIKLLDFMEKRWNFKFKNEQIKTDILFLKLTNHEEAQNGTID